ncbi:MAG TPA: RNA chaperone Hfq [Thermoanaerobaculia bacterium]|nr:RNA chaperone Hfq [Thermoanaerobaculia bacterium]
MKHNINIQDGYLFQSLKAAERLSVHLLTGDKYEGVLKRFDRFALVLESGGREILIYKHAIATVAPGSASSEE